MPGPIRGPEARGVAGGTLVEALLGEPDRGGHPLAFSADGVCPCVGQFVETAQPALLHLVVVGGDEPLGDEAVEGPVEGAGA